MSVTYNAFSEEEWRAIFKAIDYVLRNGAASKLDSQTLRSAHIKLEAHGYGQPAQTKEGTAA